MGKLLTTDVQNLLKSIATNTDYELPTATPETTLASTSAALEPGRLLETNSLQDLLPTPPFPSTNQDYTIGNRDNNEENNEDRINESNKDNNEGNNEDRINDSNSDSEWTLNGTNVTNLFRQYQHKISTQVADKGLFQAESDLQEVLAVSNILFLAPNQHSNLKVQVFGCQIVDSLCQDTINRFMDNLEVDFSPQEVSDLATIVDDI
jgi:hypothetical protein